MPINVKNAAGGTVSVATIDDLMALLETLFNTLGPAETDASSPVVQPDCLPFFHLDLDETKREVKATAGRVAKAMFANYSDAVRYVKWYNAAAASVTVGTTTPVWVTVLPPRNASGDPSIVFESFAQRLYFSSGITVACVTGRANNSADAPGADDVLATIAYE